MADTDSYYQQLGLPVASPEDAEELSAVLSNLADPNYEVTVVADTTPDPTGGNKIDTVFYVNFIPENLQEPYKSSLNVISTNVASTQTWISNKAGEQVQAKVGTGEIKANDTSKMATYKALVINHLTQNTPWITTIGIDQLSKDFKQKREDFHDALITNFTQGLNLPASINTKLEGLFTNIQSTLKTGAATSNVKNTYFIVLTIFTKDVVAQNVRAYLRTISFKFDQKLIDYQKSKGDKSWGQNVDFVIQYVQADGQFNNALYASSVQATIEKANGGASSGFAGNPPINVPVPSDD